MQETFNNSWAVVGFDYQSAKELMGNIIYSTDKQIMKTVINTNTILCVFSDGTTLRWIPANTNSRGYRFGKMWCDSNIAQDLLDTVILPMYTGHLKDITWIDLRGDTIIWKKTALSG